MSAHRSLRIGGESGSVLVMVAVMMAVLLMFVSFAVDVGNWFEHKRHLQLQADAAALAAAFDYNPSSCSNTTLVNRAHQYGGDQIYTQAQSGTNAYNRQTGGTPSANIGLLVNSRKFWDQPSGPTDTDIPDDTWLDHPCEHGMIDVKVTEKNLGLFLLTAFTPFKKIKYINAHARVQVLQQTSSRGSLPVGVPDPNPVAAAAIVVNEDTGALLDVKQLTLDTSGPRTVNGRSLNWWDNTGAPLSANIQSHNTGVVIALSGTVNWTATPSMTVTQICQQPLVECYQGGYAGPWKGLDYIHGYSPTATGGTNTTTPPVLRDVQLFNQTCGSSTPTSEPYFVLNGNCTIGVRLKLNYGGAAPTFPDFEVAADFPGCANGQPRGCKLHYNATTTYWESLASDAASLLTVPANSGPLNITINWKTGNGGSQKGSITEPGARPFSASSALSGPVQFVTVAEGFSTANSLTYGTHSLVVGIGVLGSLQANATSSSDPIVALRVVGGSQNQSLDCDPSPGNRISAADPAYTNLKDELAYGCFPEYKKNTGTACPGSATALWSLGQPPAWKCVALQTGNATNQVPQGMNQRVYGAANANTCPGPGQPGHNNWSQFPNFSDDDRRIIEVFITPYGAFSGNGGNTVPVVGFATFYVTGWKGSGGGGDPCDSASVPVGDRSDPAPDGYIVGHFIAYVDKLNSGGGEDPCNPALFGRCINVLTR